MKKILKFIFVIFLSLICLSSCSLFACKHKEYDVKTVEPNCFAEGYTEHTCKKCGESYKDNILPKTHHYFIGAACTNCGMEEITENIVPDIKWYCEEVALFDITTPEQLAGLASLVNSGTNFTDVKIYLDADIDLGFYEWIPIGNAECAFDGTFDGDGHTVSGLKINANYDYVGLFGNVSGKVCNLNIEDANVYVKRDYNYVSIACGYSTGEIKEVSTDGFIEAPKASYVGAIAGAVELSSIEYSRLNNRAGIHAQNFVGGIIGYINASGNLQTNFISNTGSVNGISQVGGIFGYVNGEPGSRVYGASVSADIVGDYYVGGIVGKANNVAVSTCTNEGSTVTAISYYTEESDFYAWLGGYVGYGYSVDNCINNVDITYTSRGRYVGGIIGFATGTAENCTNNGNISTYADYIGGIAGAFSSSLGKDLTYSNLSNTGNIEGKEWVGGISGILRYDDGGYCDGILINVNKLENQGKVSGNQKLGGIFGEAHLNSPHSCWYNCPGSIAKMIATDWVNKGDVWGNADIGEIIGSFWSEGDSTLTNFTATGKVTVNGEVKEGTYDVGANTNLTLSGREVYGA